MTHLCRIETDELQVSAIKSQERLQLPVLRRVWFRLESGFKFGIRLAFAKTAFPHEVGRSAFATGNLILFLAVDADQLWVNFVALRTLDLGRCKASVGSMVVSQGGCKPGRSIRNLLWRVQDL
jgi:hypothetical protein